MFGLGKPSIPASEGLISVAIGTGRTVIDEIGPSRDAALMLGYFTAYLHSQSVRYGANPAVMSRLGERTWTELVRVREVGDWFLAFAVAHAKAERIRTLLGSVSAFVSFYDEFDILEPWNIERRSWLTWMTTMQNVVDDILGHESSKWRREV